MERFTAEELRRYSRQMLLREVGGRGQEALRAAPLELRVRGPEGLVAARYLLRGGVTRLRVRAPDPRRAADLVAELEVDQPPGSLRDIAAEEPGLASSFTELLSPRVRLWARGAALGRGCPCAVPAGLTGADADDEAAVVAFAVGAALALEAMKAQLPGPLDPAPFCLRLSEGVLMRVPPPPCGCGGGRA